MSEVVHQAGTRSEMPVRRVSSSLHQRHEAPGSRPVARAPQAEITAVLGRVSAMRMAIAGTALFLLFLITVAVVHTIERWRHARAVDARLVQDFDTMIADAGHATPGDLVSIAQHWQEANEHLVHETAAGVHDDSVSELTRTRDTAAAAIVHRALALLAQPAYLDVDEAVTLAVIIRRLDTAHLVGGSLAVPPLWVRQMLGQTVARGTQAILYLGRRTATADELRHGASLATQLAVIVPPDQTDDLARVSAALTARAATLRRVRDAGDPATRAPETSHELSGGRGPHVDAQASPNLSSPLSGTVRSSQSEDSSVVHP